MVRRNDRLEQAKRQHRTDCFRYLVNVRAYFWGEIMKRRAKGQNTSGLERERALVSVNKTYRSGLNFGDCTKFNKPVTFIPNTCSLDTQECFSHRRLIPSQPRSQQ
jgi:hypothetical protein